MGSIPPDQAGYAGGFIATVRNLSYSLGTALSVAIYATVLQTNVAISSVSVSYTHLNPHDINAYSRSRRTSVQALKDTPEAIFDIHRDSAPLSAYMTTINGVETAQVMIVIGRSNPNMNANLEFARQIKATADKIYPGLMRGIYMGRGDYNQDLYPRALPVSYTHLTRVLKNTIEEFVMACLLYTSRCV